MELQGTGGRAESPEADCEVSQAEWLVTLGNDSGMCRHDPAGVVLLLVDVVDDELFGVLFMGGCALVIERTDNVDLVVVKGTSRGALVDVDDVVGVVNPETESKCLLEIGDVAFTRGLRSLMVAKTFFAFVYLC